MPGTDAGRLGPGLPDGISKSPAALARRIVTGSSGFIGGHLCARLSREGATWGIDLAAPGAGAAHRHIAADIRDLERLRDIAAPLPRLDAVFHLAASAEVLTPWGEVPALLTSNVEGTYNTLAGLEPRVAVFASSSSVYGSSGLEPVGAWRGATRPLCLYAVSKLAGETIVRDWARETGRAAVSFRFGNVIGAGCRGLIPFLAGHVLRHPEGGAPARLRGNGRLVRDYVPVEYVVRVLRAAAEAEWMPGSAMVLNLGTGRAMTNREVAGIVQHAARRLGYRLELSFEDPAGPGEAEEVVLDMRETVRLLDLEPPGHDEVRAAIAAAAVEHLHGAPAARAVGSGARADGFAG